MEALHLTAVAFLLTWTGVKGAVTQAVRLQQTVSLHCELRLQDETIWFIHRADGTLSLGMIANINPVDPETDPFIYMRRPDSRFSLVRNPSTNSSSLRIENVMETDQGLYYCATRENGEIHIGKGTRLLIAENSELFEMGLPCLIVLLSAVPLSALASSCCVFFIFLRGRVLSGPGDPTHPARSPAPRSGEEPSERAAPTSLSSVPVCPSPPRPLGLSLPAATEAGSDSEAELAGGESRPLPVRGANHSRLRKS